MKHLYRYLLPLLVFFLPYYNSAYAVYSIVPFADLAWCNSIYPTAYQNTVLFSLDENANADFAASQTGTIILTLPAGFEFNLAAGPTVTYTAGRDITALTTSWTTTAITITVTTDGTANRKDNIFFNNFQIRAMGAGSGDLYRTGGTFLVNGSTGNPTSSESFGSFETGVTPAYVSSSVSQYSVADINRNCTSTSNPILEIQVNITGDVLCGAADITQFDFSTAGDVGFSQNPLTNIATAKVFYTGQTPGFTYTNLFGSVSAPNGAFTITGTQSLNLGSGTYYFYLTYTVPSTANAGEGLDASMASFVFNAGTLSDMATPNPVGVRNIVVGAPCPQPDLPNPPANFQTVTVNSLVIPMDNAHQNLFPSASPYPFNIKAYGLVNSLLMNDIPVKWVIKAGKAKDGIDFSAIASREYPTPAVPAALQDFRGGAFIVDSTWVNNSYYAGGQTATQVITSFAQWKVAVYKLTADETVDVRYTLNARPKIAVFNNGGNQLLQTTVLDSAKVTNYVAVSTGLFTGLADCFTFCSEAHWAGDVSDTAITASVRTFVNSGGNFLAQCKGIDTYENNQGPYHFHTTNGVTIANNAIVNSYYNPDLAYNQFEGSVVANPGGSEQNWVLNGGAFVSNFYKAISSSTNPDNIFTGGAHLASPDTVGSNVFYLGGHTYLGNWSNILYINAIRMYLNAALIPAARPSAFVLDPGPNVTICSGQSVTLGGAPTGPAAPPCIYVWSPAEGLNNTTSPNPIATPTVTTVYTVVANNNGCLGGPNSVTVTVNSTPAAPVPGSNSPLCAGNTLFLTSNTIPGATYNWGGPNSFTSTLEDPSILSATTAASGTYTVYASIGGCAGPSATTAVTVDVTPAAPAAGSNSTLCSGNTLSLTASSTGSSYSWNGPNSFTSTLQNPTIPAVTTAGSGTYSVTALIGGCASSTSTVSVSISETPSAPTASSNSPVCSGQTLSLSASTIASATYSWNGPNSFTSAAQNPTIAPVTTLATGTYSVTATVSGCTSAAGTTSVTINETPAAPVAGSNSTVCSGQTLSLTATSTGTTYSWNGPNSFTSTLQNPTIGGVTTLASGTYSVTAATGGCTSSAGTTSVTINETPAALTPGSNSTVCSGQTLSLTSNTVTGATYNWNGPNSFTSTLEDPTIAAVTTAASGTYTVYATVGGCVGPNATTAVTINQTPSAPVAGSNSPVCAGTTLSLTASTIAGATYSWNGPSGFSSASQNPTIGGVTISFSGTYSVTATVAGCTSSTATTSVTVNPIPAAPTPGSNTPVCSGQTLSLTSNTIVSASYNWTGPNSFTSTLEDPTIAAVTTAAAGTYSVNVTVAGCTGSTATTSVTINATPAAPAAGSNSPLCTGYDLSLTANTIGGATYNWSGPNSFTSSLEDPVITGITVAGAGTYSVSVTVAGCTGPTATTAVTVNVAPAAPAAGSNSPVCSGNTLNLTATTIGGVTYNWTGPNSFTSTLEDPTISSVTTAASGTYSVTVTSIANGCVSAPVSTTVVTINETPSSASIGSNSPACLGGDLSLTASTIGGATYNWSGPNSFTSTLEDPVISGVTAAATGTYSLTITVAGCTSPLSTTSVVINAAAPAPTPGSNSPVCTGQTLSLTTATILSGGYNWSGPNSFTSSLEDPTIAGVTVAAAGTYSLFVTVPGCASSATGTVSVTVNVTPAAPAPGSNTPVCSGNDLSLTSTTVGGATYNWSGPNSFTSSLEDPVISGATTAASGTYSVSVTVTGCTSSTATTSVTINPIPSAPTAGSNSPFCSGTTLSLTASTIGGATYSWNGPNSFTSTSQNPTIPGASTAESGTYSVTATVLGCTGPAGTVSVTVSDPQTTTPGSNTPVCVGQTISLTATTVAGAIYNWTGPNSFTSTLEDPTIASATLAADGTYSVTVTIAGCTGPVTTTSVTVNPLPASPSLGSNSPVCIGSDLSLTATTIAGTTYLWNGPNSFTSTLENPTIAAVTTAEAGTYSLNVTSVATGCVSNTATVSVIINPPPASPTLGSNSPVCSGNTLSLTATTLVGATYSWSGPNSFTSTLEDPTIPGVTTLAAGTYSMTATVSGCPPLATETITVTINQTPSAPLAGSDSPVCEGDDISLTASAAGATYNWTGPNSFTSTLQNPVISAATTAMSGTYSVTATSVDGCTGPAGTTSVTVNPIPAAPVAGNNSPICEGQTLSLTANTIGGATYSWSGPNSFTSTLEDPTIAGVTTADAGTYTVNVTVLGCTGPDAVTTVTINATPAAPVAGSNSPICSGQTLSLTASVIGGATYSWSGPLGFTSTSQNPSIAAATTSHSGTYSVTATVGGCTGPAGIISVTVNPTPAIVANANSPVCTGNTLSLTATTVAGATYSWTGPNSFTSTLQNPTIPGVSSVEAGTYTVIATSALGCVSNTATKIVIVTAPIFVNAGVDQTVCANNLTVTLAGIVSGGTTTGIWSSSGTGSFIPGNTALTGNYIPSALDTAAGIVTLTLTSTANGGCTAVTDEMIITIIDAPIANAGADQTVCANNAVVTLSGSINSSATGGLWASSGTGAFSPDNVSLFTTYIPDATDTANGTVTLTLTTTGVGSCSPVTDTMIVTITDAPVVNAGADISVCINNPNAALSGTSTTGSGIWTTLGDPGGTFNPAATTLTATFVPTAADISGGSVILVLTSTANGLCNPEDDSVTVFFTPLPTVSAGSDATVCANNSAVTLSGTSSTGSGSWTSSGNGAFSPNPNTLAATYTAGSADISSGFATLTLSTTNNGGCLPVTDQMTITITPAPTANAGPNQSVCANNDTVTLSGSFTISSGAIWSTSGSGTFSPDNITMTAAYIPSNADTAAGSVTITLTTTGNGLCNAVSDVMIITITNAPKVNAGINTVACKNNPNVPLNGTSSTGSGIWTILAGTGTFVPTATTLNATYNAGLPADTTAGIVTLILTSTGNGGCLAEDDTIIITYIDKPIVFAGNDTTVCSNNDTVYLNGSSNTGSGGWTTNGSGTFADSSLLSTTYDPSAGDISAGSILIYLASTNNGTCNPVLDSIVVTFAPSPTANAGLDETVCANNAVVTLSGAFTISSGAGWTTLGSGIFSPDTFSMGATYTPSPADTTAGSVTIILTTTGNAGCLPVTDTMIITIINAPLVNAGADKLVCLSNPVATLNGTSTTGSGTWTTLGSGTFGNALLLSTTYTAGTGDTTAGSVQLVLTSTSNGLCNAVTDTILLTFVPTPVVNAGSDVTVCANNATVTLTGTSSTAAGVWTTSGTGAFTPDDSLLTASYIPSALDALAGSVTVTLTSINGCTPISDSLIITITPAPVVDAGPFNSVCVGTMTALLNGSVSGGATTGIWSTSGSGTFTPNDSALNATYTLSSADSAAGVVTLTLTSTNNGNCNPVSDVTQINVVPGPSANAGIDTLLCATQLTLYGSVIGGSGQGMWTSLSPNGGTFSPDSTFLNAVFTPASGDTQIVLVLTTTNNGPCSADMDTMVITIIPPPISNAGSDVFVCKNNLIVNLSGQVLNTITGQWSTLGGGTFLPSPDSLNVTYIPSTGDTAAGSVTILLVTTGIPQCVPDTDTVMVFFTPMPVVNAGSNILVCEGDTIALLNGSVSAGATTGQWSTLGDGTFSPNDSTLNGIYILGTGDTAAGIVTLMLVSTNNGNCFADSDTVVINISPLPVVSAGPDTTVCANNDTIFLNGSVAVGSTTGFWSTSGSGTFSPDSSALNATYTPSNADTAAGTVVLTLTSTNGCTDISDSLVVTITDAPVVNAGPNISVCGGISVSLNGSVSAGATTGQWTTSGNGTFNPNDSTLNATYILGSNDTNTVTLVLTSTGNGQCLAVSDAMTIIIGKLIAAFANNPDCQFNVAFTDTSVLATGDSIISWNWNFGDAGTSTLQNPVHIYASAGTYTVQLIVTTTGGCTDTISKTISLSPLAVADFSPTSGTYNVGTTVAFTDLSTNASSWAWNFGDGGTDILQNPSHTYTVSGTVEVILIITNSNGCPDSAKYSFIFNTNIVAVPSAFTPNGDGINDILKVRGGPLKDMDWRIYNEWGNELFHAATQDEGWDGTYKGKVQPAARYVYILKGTTYGDDKIDMKGDVTIIK